MSQRHPAVGIALGILLLIGLQIIGFFIFLIVGDAIAPWVLGASTDYIAKRSWGYSVLFYAVVGMWLYQLIYVVPLTLLLKRQRAAGLRQGIIAGAVITALISGSCFIFFAIAPLFAK